MPAVPNSSDGKGVQNVSKSTKQHLTDENNHLALGVSLGLLLGMALGVLIGIALGNMAFMSIGIGAGLAIGVAMGTALQERHTGTED